MPGGNRPHKWPQVSLPVAVAVYGSGQRPTKLLDRELARSIAIAHLFRRGRGTGGADFARGSCFDELPPPVRMPKRRSQCAGMRTLISVWQLACLAHGVAVVRQQLHPAALTSGILTATLLCARICDVYVTLRCDRRPKPTLGRQGRT